MPSSSVLTFAEPGEYAAAIRATTIDLTVTGRGKFRGKRTRIDFHGLWMQRLYESQARVLHSSFVPGRAIITFNIGMGPGLIWGGSELDSTNIIRHAEGEEAFQHASGPANWGAMSLPVADMVSIGAAVAGLDLTPPSAPLILTPSLAAFARLQRLHEAAGTLAEDAPSIIAQPAAAHGLEQALVEALMDCLRTTGTHEDRAAVRQHAAIMRRFHRVIDELADQPLYVSELCRAVGASRRTLETCCREHLDMGPKHYLLLRRMQMVRRALRASTPADTTVTEVATRYGFWELGRLAAAYKACFGELPSVTLAQALVV
jgi:AraC-like DNA-binding protein